MSTQGAEDYWRSQFANVEDLILDDMSPEDFIDAIRQLRQRRIGVSPFTRRQRRLPSLTGLAYTPNSQGRSWPYPVSPAPFLAYDPPISPVHRTPLSRSAHRRPSVIHNSGTPVITPVVPAAGTPTLPHNTTWHAGATPGPVIRTSFRQSPSGLPQTPVANSPCWHPWTPAVLPQTPVQQAWAFPADTLAWAPHPAPNPCVPATQFWTANPLLGNSPLHISSSPLDPLKAGRLTGGWPLPGTLAQWTPGAWPPCHWETEPAILHPRLIPNPVQNNLPQISWDIAQKPITAKRISAKLLVTDASKIYGEQATMPAVKTLYIACDAGSLASMWGPIVVERFCAVTVGDIMDEIYEYFNKQLTQSEVDQIYSYHPDNASILAAAYYKRCLKTPALPGFELTQGLRRVDCIGDQKLFWGMWITFYSNRTWHLNLGLQTPSVFQGW